MGFRPLLEFYSDRHLVNVKLERTWPRHPIQQIQSQSRLKLVCWETGPNAQIYARTSGGVTTCLTLDVPQKGGLVIVKFIIVPSLISWI